MAYEMNLSTDDFEGTSLEDDVAEKDSDSDGSFTISSSTSSDSTSGSSGGGILTGSSSTSSTTDYSTTEADVASGTVNALTRDGSTESEQLAEMEETMDGALDSHSVSTKTNADGSTSVTVESNLGETVTATSTGTPLANSGSDGSNPGGGIPKKVILGLVVAAIAVFAGGD